MTKSKSKIPSLQELVSRIPPVQRRKNEILLSVGARILDTLKSLDMTQRRLAEELDVEDSYLSRVVNADSNLTIETIARIEIALATELVTVPEFMMENSQRKSAKLLACFPISRRLHERP